MSKQRKWVTDGSQSRCSAGNGYASLRAANVARQAEWDPADNITLAYRGNELAGEVGEACNVIKKLERERLGIRGSRATTEQLAEELADAVICLDLIAMQAGIDLDAAVRAKFNATSEKYGLATRISDEPQTVEVTPGTREWIVSQALWRMYEHGKHGRPASAQCEVQYVTNLLNGVVTREATSPVTRPQHAELLPQREPAGGEADTRSSADIGALADGIVSEMHSVLPTQWDRDCLRAKVLTALRTLDEPQEAPDYRACFLDTLKMLHEALDVIEVIDSECLLPGQLKDLADAALVHRNATTALSRPECK